MATKYQNTLKQADHRAFVLLIVLAAVAILIMLYAAQLSIFSVGKFPGERHDKGTVPWTEEARIWDPNKPVPRLKPDSRKPAINTELKLQAPVKRNGSDRGQITLIFGTDGLVDGFWDCTYSHSQINYSIESDFTGNIDPAKTYTTRTGKDVSKLFFITRGSYTQTIKNFNTGQTSITTGLIYTTGYLNKDLSAFGTITITDSDKSWYATYTWHTQP